MGYARRVLFVLAVSAVLALNNAAFAAVTTPWSDQAGVSSKTITAKVSSLSDHSCDSSEWH
ncbi:MAG: hypothetical protein ACRDGE_02355, partial [Candidatus Limnocylindria bacterium]